MSQLVPMTPYLKKAGEGKYALGAFNANNMEIVQAIVAAAEAEQAPVILQASQGAIKYAGIEFITSMVKTAAKGASVPVILHLDHGTDFDQVMLCLRHGFSSVMIDGSKHSLEDNIKLTKKVVEVAHAMGVSVEAELGKIGGTEDNVHVEDRDALFTDPDEAKYFVAETGVDALAIAVGTAHGVYKFEPKLDYDRIAKIASLVDVPLVLHGSSGVPSESIAKAISLGICKVNIDTNLREAFVNRMRAVMAEKPKEIDPRKIIGPARDAMTEVVREKIRLFGTTGKA